MQTIRLKSDEWNFNPSDLLGKEGGFGEVFRGTGPAGDVAIKRLKITAAAAAHRELNIGGALYTRRLEHVVPVLDYGLDAESNRYFLVMPICERSLQDKLDAEGPLPLEEVKAISLNILSGLQEVGDIVHRDLKPDNVLYYGGLWRLADFGIAKFVEDSTSLETLREALTPYYGAPEQWNNERPTPATDIYALGCIIYTMINGAPPFVGDLDDLREQHLHKPAPILGVEARLANFVGLMLRKAPAARPTIDRCIGVIQSTQPSAGRVWNNDLLAVAGEINRATAEKEAQEQATEAALRQRNMLGREACDTITKIFDALFADIEAHADFAKRIDDRISITKGSLQITPAKVVDVTVGEDRYNRHDGWDIVATAAIEVRRAPTNRPERNGEGHVIVYAARLHPSDEAYTRSATLFFGKRSSDSAYRWWELAFYEPYGSRSQQKDAPYSVDVMTTEFAEAFLNRVQGSSLAYQPIAIDGEDTADFVGRWMKLFTKAVQGVLVRPAHFPLSLYQMD